MVYAGIIFLNGKPGLKYRVKQNSHHIIVMAVLNHYKKFS